MRVPVVLRRMGGSGSRGRGHPDGGFSGEKESLWTGKVCFFNTDDGRRLFRPESMTQQRNHPVCAVGVDSRGDGGTRAKNLNVGEPREEKGASKQTEKRGRASGRLRTDQRVRFGADGDGMGWREESEGTG